MTVTAPRPFEEDPLHCLCDCLFPTVAQRAIIICKSADYLFRADSYQIYATKYLACG
jgi:hypothetical protein